MEGWFRIVISDFATIASALDAASSLIGHSFVFVLNILFIIIVLSRLHPCLLFHQHIVIRFLHEFDVYLILSCVLAYFFGDPTSDLIGL